MKKFSFIVFVLFLSSCINSRMNSNIYYEKKSDMPIWYKEYYPMVKKHFKRNKDTFYVYFRGSCFRDNNIILNKEDTLSFFNKKYPHKEGSKYTSKIKSFPNSKKYIKVNYKGYNFKVKPIPEYYFTTICVNNDTLNVIYYDYPMIDIVK